ncbi:hypothetical protein [Paraglaciecola psychrophila]|uniref:Uncharacterized protein n=1 Tax=Paraglaciecola psychrophila 170 TaxID=1129794 RepID=K7ATH7_9ALTE|nr:hypothetical protein [Paraglaciecola psychrophila]AGH46741.1 hypothetical protein C427_4642 [Paraglaciecola psychrophila 170]GAC38550.1 hypothetical protein GPSY_2939 [Paraglaciecola psychrophila 170]
MERKVNLKVVVVILLFITLIGIYFFIISKDNYPEIHADINKSKSEPVVQKQQVNLVRPILSSDTKIDKQIQALKNKANDLYAETLRKGESIESKQYSYEENWCVAAEDLSQEDYLYAKKLKKEWMLSRGYAYVSDTNEGIQLFRLNDEYLEPYKEIDKESLIQFANDDDLLALLVLVQSDEVSSEVRSKAAQQLVVQGNVSVGLSQLVMDELNNARFAYSEGSDNKEAKEHILQSLAMVEYGLQRKDLSALNAFLMFTNDFKDFLNGLDPKTVVSNADFLEISDRAESFYKKVNEYRAEKNLGELDDKDISKIGDIHYQELLSTTFDQYNDILTSNLFPDNWKETYINKTPCVSRLIARKKYLTEQLPEINRKIRQLERMNKG